MKRIMTLLAAALALCSCQIDGPEHNELTTSSLGEYASVSMKEFIVCPALELGACLFAEEYMNADEAGQKALLKQYGLGGKFHQIDPKSFALDGFGEIDTEMKDWKKEGGCFVAPGGARFVATRNAEGMVSEFTASGGPFDDGSMYKVEATASLPDGEIRFTNPLLAKRIDWLYFSRYPLCLEENGLNFSGAFKLETSSGGRALDWVILTGEGNDHLVISSSRD